MTARAPDGARAVVIWGSAGRTAQRARQPATLSDGGEHTRKARRSDRREEPRPGDRAPSTHDKLDSYWWASTRPLPVLVFLLPLVLAYELGSAVYLTNPEAGTRKTTEAQKLFGDFFQALGVVGLFVPGVALVTVLLVWHVMSRDPWRIRGATLLGMLAESIAWALPLLVLSALYSRMSAMAGIGPEEPRHRRRVRTAG